MFLKNDSLIDLGPQAEAAWLQLKRHLEWSQGFTLGFLFVSSSPLLDELRRRLERAYLTRVSKLQVLKPDTPQGALDAVMRRLRESSPLLDDMGAPLWVELQEHANDKAWEKGRELLLARLNEHRELLRQRLCRPLILVLPEGYQIRVRELSPDLWSIRDFSIEIGARISDEPNSAAAAEVGNELDTLHERNTGQVLHGTKDNNLVEEWNRLQQRAVHDPNAITVGWRAIDALLSQGRPADAYGIAKKIIALIGKESVADQRSLVISLAYQGDTAFALGQLAEAEAAYAESLGLMRTLREQLGDTPEVLRDLSISLIKVGDVARAQGRLAEAEAAYAEVAALLRRLDDVFPGQEYGPWLKAVEEKSRNLFAEAEQED